MHSQNYYSELAKCMDPALVIVLSEHLGLVAERPDDSSHSEHISQSGEAWLLACEGFSELEKSFACKLEEWRVKWEERFKTENTAQMLAEGVEELKKINNARERERRTKDLYHSTMHGMVGDAQKHVVTLNARAELLQEKIRKLWHRNCSSDSYSKILPSLEKAFQNYEETFFSGVRESMPQYSYQKFVNATTANCAILNFYFSTIFGYVAKMSSNLCKFYSKKWTLYARGFSSRQNNLPLGMP